jgi:flagellar biosynthesis protein FlhB
MFDDQMEKTEAPTLHRRAEARRDGNVARSADLTSAAMLLAGVTLLMACGSWLVRGLEEMLVNHLSGGQQVPPSSMARMAAGRAAPIAAGVMLIGLAIGAIQTGFLLAPRALMPRLARLSPARGLRQIMSARSALRLGLGVAKLLLVAVVTGLWAWSDMPAVLALTGMEAEPLLKHLAALAGTLAMKVTFVLMILGLVDYGLQWALRERELRMTRWEWKEELKRTEGDPLHKQRRRKLARDAAGQRHEKDLSLADMVVTDPQGVAAAVRYDARSDAPQMVAGGLGAGARRILHAAQRHGVPVVERPALARSLCRHVEPRRPIPMRFYEEVAQALADVYHAREKRTASS